MHQRLCSILLICFTILIPITLFAFDPKQDENLLASKEFFRPELYISSAHVPMEQARMELSNSFAWDSFLTTFGRDLQIYIDPRSGTPTNIMGAIPLYPGKGFGNRMTLDQVSETLGYQVSAISEKVVQDLVRHFILNHQDVLAVDVLQLGNIRASKVSEHLWQINVFQAANGVPVRYGRISATINHGNLVTIGTETWGNVKIDTQPRLKAQDALRTGFNYAGGRIANDFLVKQPELEIIPYAAADLSAPLEQRQYQHALVWSFAFQRMPEAPVWEVLVDAHSGEVIAFQDKNHYVKQKIVGGVYPMTSTEICPTDATCGTMQSQYPMPWANTGLAAPNNFSNSAGVFEYTSGTVTTTLNGLYVRISDVCGAISNSATGTLDLGGINGQHDCTSAGGSAGNTSASRSCFYEVNKLAEMARGWLPGNTWLQNQITANVNIAQTCNAFYSPSAGNINFYRSGGGCRNTGEIAGVFDHEWGHALDDNDSGGSLSNSSEGYADIVGNLRLQASCVGHGFFWTSNKGCGTTADGTGFNQDEDQTAGLHCNVDCSGVRDSDWDKHADHIPDTPQNFVCGKCLTGTGPCGRQVHCAAAPVRQAAWDLAARDLQSAPFNYDNNTAFITASKIFFQGSGNVGSWHACDCNAGTSNGCGSTNGYIQWLAADDDNGNINDGTPHMTAIFNAYNRHNIACSTPTPQNSGCSGAPTGTATVNATPGDHSVSLTWSSVSNADEYWVLRTEGHAGCNFGKTLIAEVTGTSFTDTQVGNDRPYSYVVVAADTNDSCFAPASACVSATPTGGGCTLPATPALLSPANGATNISTTPVLDWSNATDAATYEVQVATDAAFTNIVRSATGLTTSQWTVSPALSNGTTYFWRARGVNSCGAGAYSAVFSFTTVAAPAGDFSIACSPSSLSVARGGSVTSTCTVSSIGGFSSPVSLSCAGTPNRVSCSFSPNPVTPPSNGQVASTLTISTQRNARTGTYNFNVVGTSGSNSHSTPIQLTITRR
jgi:fibronectin type 3 domain-containing protein